MDYAYSLEFKEVIDAEKAYDLYQSKIIKNKRAFECPSENCTAQTTCVNIDRPIQETKKTVHFRAYGEHIDNCPFNIKRTSNTVKMNDSNVENNKISNVHILTERPDDYYIIKQPTIPNVDGDQLKNDRKKDFQRNFNTNSPKKHYWIAPLVTTYINLKENRTILEKTFLKKNEIKIPFTTFFVEINDQNIDNISKYPRIYYGKAFFNKKNSNEIEIKFSSSFCIDKEFKKPALKLDLNSISTYKNYNYWKKRLDEAIESNRPYMFFVYGVPSIIKWNKENKVIKYIRFKTSKLDYMDLRIKVLSKEVK